MEGGTDSALSSLARIKVCFFAAALLLRGGGDERGTLAGIEESGAGSTSAEAKKANEMPELDERGPESGTPDSRAEGAGRDDRPDREDGGSDLLDGLALVFLLTENLRHTT